MAYSYFIWLAVFVAAPLLAIWGIWWRVFVPHLKVIGLAPIGALVFSIPWDIISVREHIWYFERPYIAGIWVGGLPIEEYLFIVLVTVLFASATVVVWSYSRN